MKTVGYYEERIIDIIADAAESLSGEQYDRLLSIILNTVYDLKDKESDKP